MRDTLEEASLPAEAEPTRKRRFSIGRGAGKMGRTGAPVTDIELKRALDQDANCLLRRVINADGRSRYSQTIKRGTGWENRRSEKRLSADFADF